VASSSRTTVKCFVVISSIWRLSHSLSSVRKFFTSTGYSPTSDRMPSLSSAGAVKTSAFVSGVRKQPTEAPRIPRGGKLGGTPTTTLRLPASPR
jgi:hypothetical protein